MKKLEYFHHNISAIKRIIWVVIITIFLVACRGETVQVTSSPKPTRTETVYTIIYTARGGGKGFVTYTGAEGDFVQEVVDLPWEQTIQWIPRPGQNARMTLTERVDSRGELSCVIRANGIIIETNKVESSIGAGCVFWPNR